MDRRRGGDPPPRRHRHHLDPVLETVSHGQAGIPAGRHDLHPAAETEGRVPSALYTIMISLFKYQFEIFKMVGIATMVTIVISTMLVVLI